MKKAVLALGGADALVVLDTDDLDGPVAEAVVGRMDNAGPGQGDLRVFVTWWS